MDWWVDWLCLALRFCNPNRDTSLDASFLGKLCENNLVFTSSLIVEVAIAFPIRRDLASGFSYWIQEGKRNGADIQTAKENFNQNWSCDIHFSKEAESEGVSLSSSLFSYFGIAISINSTLLFRVNTQRSRLEIWYVHCPDLPLSELYWFYLVIIEIIASPLSVLSIGGEMTVCFAFSI